MEIMKSLRSNLVGALLGLGTLVGAANAEQVVVYQAALGDSAQALTADFAVNRELGRAWVDVEVQPVSIGSEPAFATSIPRSVEGLYYDPSRNQVLYRAVSGNVVCAEDAGRTDLKATGNCRLVANTEQRKVDDGFGVHEQAVAQIALDVQAPQAAAVR
jgi:hypothetical protein